MAGALDFIENCGLEIELLFKNVNLLIHCLFFLVKHLQKSFVFK